MAILPNGIRDVTPIEKMSGDSDKDSALLRTDFERAKHYLNGFSWCRSIRDAFFGMGVGGVVAVFLFHIEPVGDVDSWLWVIVGDLPSAYLVTDDLKSPRDALEGYCELMMDWVNAVKTQADLTHQFPVEAPPTLGNAAALKKRIGMLREAFDLS